MVLARSLCRAIAESQAQVDDGAERIAIGQRRYVQLAAESPAWALLLLDVWAASPTLVKTIEAYPLADLRLAVKQKRVKVASEAVALDLLQGFCSQAMRRVASGEAPARHDVGSPRSCCGRWAWTRRKPRKSPDGRSRTCGSRRPSRPPSGRGAGPQPSTPTDQQRRLSAQSDSAQDKSSPRLSGVPTNRFVRRWVEHSRFTQELVMDKRASSSRLVSALAVVVVSIAALAAAVTAWQSRGGAETRTGRPAADARVDVVKAPAVPVVHRVEPCPTCAMGAGRQL